MAVVHRPSVARARVVVIAAILAGLVAGTVGRAGERQRESLGQGTRLQRAIGQLDAQAAPGGYPSTRTAVRQLSITDPASTYAPLASADQLPAAGSIGVYAATRSVWLRTLSPDGNVRELAGVATGPHRGTYGPVEVTRDTTPDGAFEAPIESGWTVQTGPIARVARDTDVVARTPGSLRIFGTGAQGAIATAVSQVLDGAGPAPAHTQYLLGLVARTQSLSRPLAVGLKLTYRDGSSGSFVATSLSHGDVVSGVPAGTSDGWIPVTLTAVADKPVRSVQLFAADTGTQPLRGTAWVDRFVFRRS